MALVVMLVAGGLVAAFALMVCYPAWRRTRLGKLFISRHGSSPADAAARLGSVYLTNGVAEDMMSVRPWLPSLHTNCVEQLSEPTGINWQFVLRMERPLVYRDLGPGQHG